MPQRPPSDLVSSTDCVFEHPLLELYARQQEPDLDRFPREIRNVLSCIHRYLFEPGLSVQLVRKRCHIRDNNISSRFRRALGKGMKNYIDDHRIAAACSLLTQSPLAIFDIALAVGYLHVETFYKRFYLHFECTPGDYRKSQVSTHY